jgi:cobalamin biosynthesis protein CobD/CbiB
VEKTEGAAIAGHHCFVTLPLLSFLFLGHVFAVAPAFFWFQTIVSVWLLYLYSGAKACFERATRIEKKTKQRLATRRATNEPLVCH